MSGLVHPPGTQCAWCKLYDATTTLYDWPTCLSCAAGGPKKRVMGWLQQVKRSKDRMESDGR